MVADMRHFRVLLAFVLAAVVVAVGQFGMVVGVPGGARHELAADANAVVMGCGVSDL